MSQPINNDKTLSNIKGKCMSCEKIIFPIDSAFRLKKNRYFCHLTVINV